MKVLLLAAQEKSIRINRRRGKVIIPVRSEEKLKNQTRTPKWYIRKAKKKLGIELWDGQNNDSNSESCSSSDPGNVQDLNNTTNSCSDCS